MRNHKGRGSGLTFIILLIVALLVAYLTVSNLSSLGVGGSSAEQSQAQQDLVKQAQDAVDAVNQRIGEALQAVGNEA